ncbi:hypothetical protein [Nocardia sp. alder85J]|nr:hypothetical protein [Nocardia sp. alder85J]MCX4091036.1 hypothetical protein [Nocardia sp. alder85J]
MLLVGAIVVFAGLAGREPLLVAVGAGVMAGEPVFTAVNRRTS